MSATGWIITTPLVLLAVVAVVYAIVHQRRRRELRRLFGPDFDRRIDEPEDTGADSDERPVHSPAPAGLGLRPLSRSERERYRADWARVQSSFVDRPALALHEADTLVSAVFVARGFPLETFEQPPSMAPAEHAETVRRYQAAQSVHLHADSTETGTDELRAAFVQYRELFEELISERPLPADSGQHVSP